MLEDKRVGIKKEVQSSLHTSRSEDGKLVKDSFCLEWRGREEDETFLNERLTRIW